jgi:hypothetical protein
MTYQANVFDPQETRHPFGKMLVSLAVVAIFATALTYAWQQHVLHSMPQITPEIVELFTDFEDEPDDAQVSGFSIKRLLIVSGQALTIGLGQTPTSDINRAPTADIGWAPTPVFGQAQKFLFAQALTIGL